MNGPRWAHTLNLSDIFHSDAYTYHQRRDIIVRRIRAAGWFKSAAADGEDIGYLVDDLATSVTPADFDTVWDDIYDWCDEQRVWVNT